MEIPPKFDSWSLSENFQEWVAKHQFAQWYMVDMDNWMAGNPLVIPRYKAKATRYSDLGIQPQPSPP